MRKEFVLIISLALVILVGLFSYILKDIPDNQISLLNEVSYEPLENYVLSEDGSFIENTNIGLKMIVPPEWIVKKVEGIGVDDNGVMDGAITIYSPDSEIDDITHIAYKGCGISVRFEKSYKEKQFHMIASTIENIETGNEIEGSQLILISQKNALWETILEEEEIGKVIMVSLPIDDNIYIFETILPPIEKERCEASFKDFLTKVEIIKK